MELQSILINFTHSTVEVLFEDKLTVIDMFVEVNDLKSDFDLVYGIVYDNIVVQLTEDQHMCEPRLLFFDGSDNPDTMTSTIIHMTKVATLHPELYLKFKDFRLKIEVNLQEQIIL